MARRTKVVEGMTGAEVSDAATAIGEDVARFYAVGMNDSSRRDALDAIIFRMEETLPYVTDRAAINALAESVAELARLMR